MKKIFLITLLFFTVGISAHAQITWEKLIAHKSSDVLRNVKEVSSGGYVLAGYMADSSVNDTDGYVVRMNTVGDTLWTYRYNGSLSKKDLFYKVVETQDGGFVLCGYTSSVTGLSDDVLYVKLNSSGQEQWVKTWGGSGKDRAQDIIQLNDGTYLLAGYTTTSPALYYDAFLYHVNATGDSLWFKRYGSAMYDDANCVRALSNGGYLLGGQSSNGTNGFDQYLIRTNDSGDTLWTKKFGTPGTENIEHIAVSTSGFVLAGSTNNNATANDDGYLVKTDTSGNVIWTKSFGGDQPDDFHRVEFTTDGGLVASGTTSSSGPLLPNMWLMRTNATGDSLWSRTFGGDSHDHGYSAQQTLDGGYIICGHTGSFGFNSEDGYVVKMDGNGNIGNYLTYTQVFSLLSPTSTFCGGSQVQIKVIVRNFGRDTVPNVPVTCNITGSTTQTLNATYAGALLPQDADTLVFSTLLTTAPFGTYNFTFTTGNNNDVYPANNTFTTSVSVDGTTAAPTATDVSRCGDGIVTLTASGSGTIYWFNALSGGTQLGSGSTYVTPTLSASTPYYVQTGLNCPSSRVTVNAIITPIPADPSTTSGYTCGSGTVQLSASSANTINWYDASSGGTLLGSGSNFTTPSVSSSTTFYAEANDGTCGSNRIPAIADVHSIPAVPTTTGGAACGLGNFALHASAIASINWYNAPTGGSLIGTGTTYNTPFLTTTTTYYALANDGVCLSARVPVVAVIYPMPAVNLGPDTNLINGTVYPLDAGAGFSYSWTPNGEVTQTISPTVTSQYCVTITDANSCTASDCVQLNFSDGINTPSLNNFTIYPNPAADQVSIQLQSSFEIVTIEVVGMNGAVCKVKTVENYAAGQALVLPVDDLQSGLYALHMKATGFSQTGNFIIRK